MSDYQILPYTARSFKPFDSVFDVNEVNSVFEKMQARISELEKECKRLKDESDMLNTLVWFERDEVKGLDENQTGVIDLNTVKRTSYHQGFCDGACYSAQVDYPDELTVMGAEQSAAQRYPDKE